MAPEYESINLSGDPYGLDDSVIPSRSVSLRYGENGYVQTANQPLGRCKDIFRRRRRCAHHGAALIQGRLLSPALCTWARALSSRCSCGVPEGRSVIPTTTESMVRLPPHRRDWLLTSFDQDRGVGCMQHLEKSGSGRRLWYVSSSVSTNVNADIGNPFR